MNIRQVHIKLEMPSTLIISTFWFWDPMSNIIVTYYFDYCLRHFKTQFQSFQPDGNLARLQMVRLQPIICVNILLGSIEILLTNGHLLETHSRTSGLPEVMGTRGLVPTIHFMADYLNLFTPARTHSISGLKSRVLKLHTIFDLLSNI